MADIMRWDPFGEMQSLRHTVDRLFDETRPWRVFGGNGGTGSAGYFPVDVYETNEDVVVKASLPGVKPDDIDISVTGQLLTLKAEAREEHEEKDKNWYRRERSAGTYVRQFTLPTEVDANKAQANFEHGVLELHLPKAESMKPKQIKVQTGGNTVLEGKAS